MLPECTCVTQLIEHFHNFLHYSDPQRFAAYAIDEPKLAAIYRTMTDSMLSTVQSHFKDIDYHFLILKDPELTLMIDLIPYFFGEDSKTICVVRDPRAVIASMLEVERKKKKVLWSAWIKKPNWLTTDAIVSQLFREQRLISDFFLYYYKVQESQLYKRGGVHIVQYEKIVAREDDEFQKLEDYLGFTVGRKGFGKVPFGFDHASPTHSAGYGKTINATSRDFRKKLTRRQIKKIEAMYSGINAIYGWWK